MKQYKFYFFFLALVGLWACSSNEDELVKQDNATQQIKMIMDVALCDYDSISGTRVVNSEWKDGATIYLRFQTENGILAGFAKYDAKSRSWDCGTNGGLLTTNREMAVEAVYFDGYSSSNINGDVVFTNPFTAIYYAPNATYLYSTTNNTIKFTATLSPMTGRMRFKSTGECKSLSLGGVVGYTGYNVLTGKFTTTTPDAAISLDVDTAGYAGYVYGYYSTANKPSITITYTDSLEREFQFVADMADNSMDAGKSGWMNIPSKEKRSGWSMTYLSYKGHELVDLSLPSGLLWAKCNVGGNYEYSVGDYFAWGEIVTKQTYTADNSTTNGVSIENLKSRGCLDGNGNLTLQYDAANKNWGGTWRMPTVDDFEDLLANCSVSYVTYNELSGLKFTSKINNRFIIFGMSGYYSGSAATARNYGFYWSSTPYGDKSCILRFSTSSYQHTTDDRYIGFPIRPVTEP